jgi:dTDP-glucose 4,6-dehydratase
MKLRYFVTGGAGFIGSRFIHDVLAHEPQATVTNVDLLTYAGVRATVADLDRSVRHHFVHGDVRNAALIDELLPGHDVVVNFAAESHVDRSIDNPAIFLETNTLGTLVLLESARRHGIDRFVQVSTDEVYGTVMVGAANEEALLRPSSPYAASKAAADLVVRSYQTTYSYPSIISRCTNNYGPYQFPEKLIPLFITNLIDGERVPLYADGRHERDWLHVDDHCAALRLLIQSGVPGEVYNIGSDNQTSNIEIAKRILTTMGLGEDRIQSVPDRPGHDLRYAVDSGKIRALGWTPSRTLESGLAETVAWYRNREDWWRPLKAERPVPRPQERPEHPNAASSRSSVGTAQ